MTDPLLPVLIIVPVVAGIVSALVAGPARSGWYDSLRKPWWNPPPAVFAPVWTALYCMMGYASYRVYAAAGSSGASFALYWVQLAVNVLWSPVFFRLHRDDVALCLLLVIFAFALATTVLFWQDDTVAGALLVPYVSWLAFAACLNAEIWRLNRKL